MALPQGKGGGGTLPCKNKQELQVADENAESKADSSLSVESSTSYKKNNEILAGHHLWSLVLVLTFWMS